jgi:hypothetical protein
MASDIFRDTVTLRTVEGETRVVALAALREEMSKADPTAAAVSVEAGRESTFEAERAVLVATALHEEDAAEPLPAADAPGTAAVPEHRASPAATDVETVSDVDVDDDDASDDELPAGEDNAADGTDAPRRKRRRGRRGGRRVRGERGDPNTPPASDS